MKKTKEEKQEGKKTRAKRPAAAKEEPPKRQRSQRKPSAVKTSEDVDGETLERNAAVKKIVLTVNDDPLAAWIVQKKFNISRTEAAAIIETIRRDISEAATGSRREKLGESLARLNEIYKTSIQTMDARTALSATKELSKTQRLYNTYEDKEAAQLDPEKEAARAVMVPAIEGGENMTLDELARALVYLVIRLQTGK